ncbi:peptidoglycan-binding protein [Actinocorallia longicatena]|uniref:Peptidoglycan-binding protein n=1 Tax=Actinocorallia longicatena TaxID=111803 RepID=A0ABP6Q965_9ACTN
MRRRGRVIAALLAVGGTAVVAAAANGIGSGGQGRPQPRGKLPPTTATIDRQTLVDTRRESGTLGFDGSRTLSTRLAGTATWLPATGRVIARGRVLYRLDDGPVVLMYGDLPVYRALSAGVKGRDVRQFERNLWALGYRGFTVDETYSSATAEAVREWQDDLGLEETGSVEEGRVLFARGPVRVAARKASEGDDLQPGAAVLTTSGSARVVTVSLDVADQRLVRKGVAVAVRLPSGRSVPGRVLRSRTVVEPGENGADDTTELEVTVGVDRPAALNGLDQASLDVDFTAGRRKDVLTVPVAALLALAEGGYGVQVVENGAARIVPVEIGLFASGRVEVGGSGLRAGLVVGMPS